MNSPAPTVMPWIAPQPESRAARMQRQTIRAIANSGRIGVDRIEYGQRVRRDQGAPEHSTSSGTLARARVSRLGEADALGDKVKRPPLHLVVDAADVKPHQAGHHHVHAGEERDDDDGRGPADNEI